MQLTKFEFPPLFGLLATSLLLFVTEHGVNSVYKPSPTPFESFSCLYLRSDFSRATSSFLFIFFAVKLLLRFIRNVWPNTTTYLVHSFTKVLYVHSAGRFSIKFGQQFNRFLLKNIFNVAGSYNFYFSVVMLN